MPPDPSNSDAQWAPRKQSPAASYTSLRRYRDLAEAEKRGHSAPQPAIGAEDTGPQPLFDTGPRRVTRPPQATGKHRAPRPDETAQRPAWRPETTDTPPRMRRRAPQPDPAEDFPAFLTAEGPAVAGANAYEPAPIAMQAEHEPDTLDDTAERARLPYPGSPLFGPRGIMSQPISRPLAPTALLGEPAEPSGAIWPPQPGPAVATATLERPTFQLGETRQPHAPGYPREPRAKDFFSIKGLSQARVTSLATLAVGLVVLVAIIARPFAAGAHPAGSRAGGFTGYGASGELPTPQPDPKFTPVKLDTDHPAPILWAESGFVMDETNGNVLFAKNPYEEMPMASTTKLMTAVVAIAHGNLDQWITITADSANTGGTRMVLHVGERYTLRELLYAMLLLSANDAAEAIADGVAGDPATFVKWMNDTAKALGLDHTHYTNPHGLDDPNHYSCARDLAVLGRYALSLPEIHQISQTRNFTITGTDQHPVHNLENMHQPLWWYPGADGGKPGWTGAAQFVDILSAARDNHHLIAVIMHGKYEWVTDIRDLLNWGFDDFTWVSPKDILQHQYIPFADSYANFAWDKPERTVSDGTSRYYPYTGYLISGAFLTYYDKQGGLATFGFPRGMPTPNASGTLSQKFDKATITCNTSTGQCATG